MSGLQSKEQEEHNSRDISSNFSFLRIGKVIELEQSSGTFLGNIGVLEMSTDVVRTFPYSPVKLMFPFFGNGYGAYGVPSIGDLVILGFLTDKFAIMLGYYPINYLLQTSVNVNANFLRSLESGEFCIKSKKGAEIYWDKNGSIRVVLNNASNPSRPDNYDTKYAELTIGKLIEGTTETKYNGKSIRFQFKDTYTTIVANDGGDLEVSNGVGSIKISKAGVVTINNGANGSARIGDNVSTNLTMATLITALATWGIVPTTTPTTSTPTVATVGTITSGSATVKIG